MNIYRLLAILNTVGLAATIFVNYLANALPINGYNTGELSDLYPNYFVPAGLTFSIWGVIYIFLIIFVIYQFTSTKFSEVKHHHYLARISFFFFYSCIANISWILLWHHRLIFFSVLIMISLLVSLIYIYTRLEIGLRSVPTKKKWMVHVPFSIYLGWITVATIANITALLVDIGWNGFNIPGTIWAVIMIFVATMVGSKVFSDRKDYAYVVVLIWAFLGIFIKRNALAGITDYVAIAALFGMGLLAISLIWSFLSPKPALSTQS